MKLYFYLPILTNNNILLKIYCENIVVTFLNCHFLFFILFFISFLHTFPFFYSFVFSSPHTYTHISPSSPFFPLLSTWFQNLPLSFFLQLSHFLLFFFLSFSTWFHKFSSSLCDASHIILLAFWCHYLQTHIHTHGEKGEIIFAPPHHHRYFSSSLRSACNQGSYRLLFFFLVLD